MSKINDFAFPPDKVWESVVEVGEERFSKFSDRDKRFIFDTKYVPGLLILKTSDRHKKFIEYMKHNNIGLCFTSSAFIDIHSIAPKIFGKLPKKPYISNKKDYSQKLTADELDLIMKRIRDEFNNCGIETIYDQYYADAIYTLKVNKITNLNSL